MIITIFHKDEYIFNTKKCRSLQFFSEYFQIAKLDNIDYFFLFFFHPSDTKLCICSFFKINVRDICQDKIQKYNEP